MYDIMDYWSAGERDGLDYSILHGMTVAISCPPCGRQ